MSADEGWGKQILNGTSIFCQGPLQSVPVQKRDLSSTRHTSCIQAYSQKRDGAFVFSCMLTISPIKLLLGDSKGTYKKSLGTSIRDNAGSLSLQFSDGDLTFLGMQTRGQGQEMLETRYSRPCCLYRLPPSGGRAVERD